MHAVVVSRAGGPEVLEYKEVPTPEVKPGWSRIKVAGFGINHSEIFTREGQSPSVHFPRILGIEAVGTIDATSDPVHLPVGQKVISIMGEMGRDFDGSYAEYALLPNIQLYPVETSLSWKDLAAIPETYYTAFGIFNSFQLKPTDSVLVRAATSGVGVAVMQLAKGRYPAIKVTGTTRNPAKSQQLLKAGFDDVVVTPDANQLPDYVGSFDKIADLIGPSATRDSLQHLNEFGIVSVTGELGGVWTLDGFDPIMDIPNNRYLTGFYSGDVSQTQIQAMLDFIAHHHIDVSPIKVFDLPHIADAHRYLESQSSFGKVVVLN
ncbi:zinc-binding alcohol dehydrogenase family protein [Lacticaseibacillus saniviri]|uniref:Oxidoreductase n=1 Tax=Lacticaseibacillus saniviri JCM 17471 = DSM 24301 TaxID=1293598 RepID=A0A0R2MN73_9LACO|nr:zinc-binding alcohol dehydrogenase family protein [Lacticaseibacillus saniviri]KRO15145.1 oxidoreductase [Lacticaseibacillus saniviri JCM 17471 = DSM 24301]MCG4281151.1 zinc-binding alcohol dehydrogenase family protein [Lacticaseibacillus saniviri]